MSQQIKKCLGGETYFLQTPREVSEGVDFWGAPRSPDLTPMRLFWTRRRVQQMPIRTS